jgi:hypothetical protein
MPDTSIPPLNRILIVCTLLLLWGLIPQYQFISSLPLSTKQTAFSTPDSSTSNSSKTLVIQKQTTSSSNKDWRPKEFVSNLNADLQMHWKPKSNFVSWLDPCLIIVSSCNAPAALY